MSYEVVHEDLTTAGKTFVREGDSAEETWRAPLGSASSGDGYCDCTITELMLSFELLGKALAEVIGEHGDKLTDAANEYERTDADSALLYDTLLERLED